MVRTAPPISGHGAPDRWRSAATTNTSAPERSEPDPPRHCDQWPAGTPSAATLETCRRRIAGTRHRAHCRVRPPPATKTDVRTPCVARLNRSGQESRQGNGNQLRGDSHREFLGLLVTTRQHLDDVCVLDQRIRTARGRRRALDQHRSALPGRPRSGGLRTPGTSWGRNQRQWRTVAAAATQSLRGGVDQTSKPPQCWTRPPDRSHVQPIERVRAACRLWAAAAVRHSN
ncbi:MAG: hypothetical protein QOE54_4034 [Streptosporangiaceae bacterium]|jgi:hypothetical protein|nr:hypothetical protein [Streptosporangiaceae bacterium]MDX6431668.1 hypothetical protein [Streptosporangiaceae bacterium]